MSSGPTPTPLPRGDAMTALQAYFISACILIVLAILAGTLLTAVGMNQTQVTSMVVTIMGFAALILTQYHSAAQAAIRVEAVRREARETADKVETVRRQAVIAAEHVVEVKQTLDASTSDTSRKLAGLADAVETSHRTGQEVLTRVNGAVGIQLQIAAVALRRLADITQHTQDIAAAELAESSYGQHQQAMRTAEKQDLGAPRVRFGRGSSDPPGPIEVVVVNPPDRPVPNRPVEGEGVTP